MSATEPRYFWMVNTGSLDSLLWVPIYGGPRDRLWFRFGIMPLYRVAQRIDRLWWAAKYRTMRRHQYHIVRTDLSPGFYDIDEVMFRACFALLRRYVEHELGTKNWYPEDPSCMYRGYRVHAEGGNDEKAIDLWLWYRDDLPALLREDDADPAAFSAAHGIDYIENLKSEKLNRLLHLRRRLWT